MLGVTDQKVGGSNPSGRALLRQKVDASEMSGAFGFFWTNLQVSALSRRFSPVVAALLRGVGFS